MDHCPYQLLATLPAASRRDREASVAPAPIAAQSNTKKGVQSSAINRRTFLRKSGGVAVAAGALGTITGCLSHFVANAEHDVIIRGGLVYDGNGNDPIAVDVGIRGSRIISIGNMTGRSARRVLDATGLIVCPGFIDIHGHSDLTILQDGQAESKIRQGVTTEIIGQDGRSLAPLSRRMQRGFKAYLENSLGIRMDWYDFQGYYNAILREGISINIRSMIGAGTLRENIMGYDRRKMESYEINSVQSLIRLSNQQGARHLSSGLEYLPGSHAGTAELTELARSAGLYSTHMRNEDDAVLPALQEALTIADRAQAALNISHIKAQGNRNYDKLPTMLSMLDRARGWNRQVTCDRYPYLAYNTGLANLFPLDVREDGTARFIQHLRDPDYYDRLRSDVEYKVASLGSYHGILIAESASSKYARFEGKRLDEVARVLQKNPYDILVDMIISSGGSSTMIGFGMDEQNLHRLLRYDHCAIASDGAALNASWKHAAAHPRSFGTFPRVLGKYVREKRVLSMQAAIRKMTALPADIVGLEERGRIQLNHHADITIFDPGRVRDRATYDNPRRYPLGIEYVLVNGQVVVDRGEHTDARPGTIV